MGTKDSQYQQVGNAVPPILARAIAETVLKYLDSHEDAPEKDKILIEMVTDPEATQMEIAERAGISQSAVSMNTKRMISEGLIEKIQTDQNKKVWSVKR